VELKAIDEETFIEEIKIFINDVLFEKIRMDSFILERPTSNRGYNEFKIIAIDLAGNSATKRLSVISY
jgi:hypothetical protein